MYRKLGLRRLVQGVSNLDEENNAMLDNIRTLRFVSIFAPPLACVYVFVFAVVSMWAAWVLCLWLASSSRSTAHAAAAATRVIVLQVVSRCLCYCVAVFHHQPDTKCRFSIAPCVCSLSSAFSEQPTSRHVAAVCVRACVRACVRVCVCVCVRASVCVFACSLALLHVPATHVSGFFNACVYWTNVASISSFSFRSLRLVRPFVCLCVCVGKQKRKERKLPDREP